MISDTVTMAGRRHARLQSLGPVTALCALLAVLWGLVLIFAVVQERRMVDGARDQLRLINSGVAEQTRNLLRRAETDLAVIELWIQTHPEADPRQDAGLANLMARLRQGSDGLLSFGLATTSGLPAPIPDMQPWQAGMPAVEWGPGPGELHVGAPQRSVTDQAWRWPLSRRLGTVTGDLAGAVAWVDLDRLSAVHERLRDKPAGAIFLTTATGTLVVRTPPIESLIGRNLVDNSHGTGRPVGGPQGSFTHESPLSGGQARLATYERLGRYPVTALVSQGVDEALAAFRVRRNIGILALCLITLASFGFTTVLARSQRATRRSQAEFAALSEAFPLGLFRADTAGKTQYANEAYFQKFGRSRDDLSWAWLDAVPEEGREDARRAWVSAAAEGRPLNTVLNIRRADGQDAMLSVRTAPLRADGRLVGLVGSLEDITQRIKQQRASRMLTAIFEKTSDVVAQLDPQGRMQYLNPAGRALFEIEPTTPLTERHYDEFVPAHRETQVRDQIVPAALASGLWVGETSVLTRGGREVAVSEMLLVHRDDDQAIETFSIVMRDITQDLKARTELLRSESILKIVAATLPALVAVIDNQQRYLFSNAAYDRWTGGGHGGLLGRTIREALGEAVYAQRASHIAAALAGQRVMFESDRGDGICYETTYIPFQGADDQVAGFVALSQDITTHKRQQQKLLDASQTDPLTGTLNRTGFDQRMRDALDRAQHSGEPLTLLCVDLDRFKPVNDEHGHATGDSLLAAVARRLRQALRPSDTLARLGGDEFAVVLSDTRDEAAAATVARKIVAELSEPFDIDGKRVGIGASVGVALSLDGVDSVQTLMQRADSALYQAKRAGRGRFEMAAPAG